MESLGILRSTFSFCTDYKSSIIDFWHYKTSFTTILSNFCQLQPKNIHSLANLTKKRRKIWQLNSDMRCIPSSEGAPSSALGWDSTPWAGSEGRDTQFWLSRLHNTLRVSIWGAVWQHRPPHNISDMHSPCLSSLISCKPVQLEGDCSVLQRESPTLLPLLLSLHL